MSPDAGPTAGHVEWDLCEGATRGRSGGRRWDSEAVTYASPILAGLLEAERRRTEWKVDQSAKKSKASHRKLEATA
jgi:hypothetical protein